MQRLEKLASTIPKRLENMLSDAELPPTTQLKVYELLLDRTYGGRKAPAPLPEVPKPDMLEDIRYELDMLRRYPPREIEPRPPEED